MIKYLIIDDEAIAHDIIKGYCDLLPNLQLMKHCYDALEAFEYLNQHQVDLIFLDLNMPKLKGFEFLKTLNNPPKVIVTTAYSEYALEGYELNVVDYLLKPFGFDRFLKAINKAMQPTSKVSDVVSSQPVSQEERFFFRSNKKVIQVAINDILYAEAAGNYTKIVTIHETITIREKVSEVIQTLPAEAFVQVHKSFAVAVKHIHEIEGNRIKINDHLIPIGKTYKMNVNKLFNR